MKLLIVLMSLFGSVSFGQSFSYGQYNPFQARPVQQFQGNVWAANQGATIPAQQPQVYVPQPTYIQSQPQQVHCTPNANGGISCITY